MSRKTGTKDKTKPHAPPTTATPSVSEIIPGKFTETDWNGVLLLDDNEDFIGSFVEEIISKVDMRIRDIEIERQLAPYTVNKVMNFVHNLFKLAYPEHQPQQILDESWEPDIGPECSMIDSWAEGYVPKQVVVPISAPISTVSMDDLYMMNKTAVSAVIDEETVENDELIDESLQHLDRESETIIPAPDPEPETECERESKPEPAPQVKWESEPLSTQKQLSFSKPIRPNVTVLSVKKAAGLVEPTAQEIQVLDDTESSRSKFTVSSKAAKNALAATVGKASLQREKGRPPMEREVNYDAYGNIISMVKIIPESFPPLFVQTDYMVVDPRVEKANADLEAMRTGRYLQNHGMKTRRPVRLEPLNITPGYAAAQIWNDRELIKGNRPLVHSGIGKQLVAKRNHQPYNQLKEGKQDMRESRSIIEQIDLAPGVDIREGMQEKRGADIRSLTGAVFMPQDVTLVPMNQKRQVSEKLMDVDSLIRKPPVIKPIA